MTQSRATSVLETLNRSLISGTSALAIHYLAVITFGPQGIADSAAVWAGALWIVMFANSLAWGYVIRRIYERYGVQLDARNIYKLIRLRVGGWAR